MPITYMRGDILQSECDYICIPVNAVGVAGKGLALAWREKDPYAARKYKTVCRSAGLQPGGIECFTRDRGGGYWVVCVTKADWRHASTIAWVRKCCENLRDKMSQVPIRSLAIPALGCGLGELHWERVKEIMLTEFHDLPNEVHIYEPQ